MSAALLIADTCAVVLAYLVGRADGRDAEFESVKRWIESHRERP